MKLHELKPQAGSTHAKKRVGRGTGSGLGKFSTRGANGQNKRSGGGVRFAFEGGQTPLFKRLPKRGFHNVNRKEYAVVNVEQLNVFKDGDTVTPESLIEKGFVKKIPAGIKLLGKGKLTKKLTVKVTKASVGAKNAVLAAGGTLEVL